MTWVLDASAVVCWLRAEPGWQRMREVVTGGEPVLVHAVNVVEILYYFLRRGEQALHIAMERFEAVNIGVVRTMDDPFLAIAARLKAHHAPIALGDTFAVALTMQLGATLLSTDRGELERLALSGLCPIEFLR